MMPQPRQMCRYLYHFTLMPTESAAPGFSPTARRRRPGVVRFMYHHMTRAMTTAR